MRRGAVRSSTRARVVAALSALALAAWGCKRIGPEERVASLASRAVAHRNAGRFDAAMVTLDSAIAIDSTRASLWRERGAVWQRRFDFPRSIHDFERAIALDPDFARAYASRGFSRQLMKAYAPALADYDRSLSLDSTLATTRMNRARTLLYLDRPAESAADFERALPRDSMNLFGVLWLHIARQRAGLPSDTAWLAERLAAIDSVTWPAAVARYYLGRIDAAKLTAAAEFDDGKTLRPDRCPAFYIGQALVWRRDTAGAVRKLTAARGSCPPLQTEHHAAAADVARLTRTR